MTERVSWCAVCRSDRPDCDIEPGCGTCYFVYPPVWLDVAKKGDKLIITLDHPVTDDDVRLIRGMITNWRHYDAAGDDATRPASILHAPRQ